MGNVTEKITILKDEKEVECEILFTFDCEETGKSYVGYTDNEFGTNGRKNIYISSYDTVVGTGELYDVTDPEELAMVQEVLAQIDEESRM
ncbi:MAG: DUF1292 domain-containing protein [bacterium]|nr:DUF1292 domain-containing protein [bacterium]